MQRQDDTDVYSNPDGTRTARLYAGPHNRRDSAEGLQPIEAAFTPEPGRFSHRGASLSVQLARRADDPALVRAEVNGRSASFGLENAAPARGVASGAKLRYPAVAPGIDLEYHLSSQGLKELVVLRDPLTAAASTSFRFPLHLTGLTPRARADGSVGLFDDAGSEAISIPAATAWDSGVDPLSNEPSYGPARLGLLSERGSWVLVLSVDAAWLTDPTRIFPVYLDPTLRAGLDSPIDDAFVSSAYPTTNYDGSWDQTLGRAQDKVGFFDATSGTNVTYLHYDLGFLANREILSARWNGFFIWSYSTTPTPYRLHPVASSWTPGTVTWNGRPTQRPESADGTGVRDQWSSTDVTAWVRNWTTTAWPNHGIAIDDAGAGQAAWKKLAAAENIDGTSSYLEVTYAAPVVAAVPTDRILASSGNRAFGINKGTGKVRIWGGGNPVPRDADGIDDAVAVAGNMSDHALALTADGDVYQWNLSSASGFEPVTGLPGDMVDIAAGGGHSLAVDVNGDVWAWGSDSAGQLGRNTSWSPGQTWDPIWNEGGTFDATPAMVLGPTDVVAVSAGYDFSLALSRDGSVWGWGNNQWGALCNGRTGHQIDSDQSMDPVYEPRATKTTLLSGIRSLAAGIDWSLFVRADGTASGCGHNENYVLAHGQFAWFNSTATPLTIPGLSGAISVATGGYGYSLARLADGTVRAWGSNISDGLSVANLYTIDPQPVVRQGPGNPVLTGVVAMAAGPNWTMFVTADTKLWEAGAHPSTTEICNPAANWQSETGQGTREKKDRLLLLMAAVLDAYAQHLATTQQPRPGQRVYRVWGGQAPEFSQFWTPTNPEALGADQYRIDAGLPDRTNSGTFVTSGEIDDPLIVSSVQLAAPINPDSGPAPGAAYRPYRGKRVLEYLIVDAENRLSNNASGGLSPPYGGPPAGCVPSVPPARGCVGEWPL